MARKRHTAEDIAAKLRQVDVLMAQGRPVADAVRAIRSNVLSVAQWVRRLKGGQVSGSRSCRPRIAVFGARSRT
jgi:putative transposase